MSIGGILASAIGGAAKNGVAMADKIGTENRKAERDSAALEDQRQYAEKQSNINYERDKESANLLYDRQKERDKANHGFSMALASAKSSKTNSGSVKINPLVKQRVDVLTGLMKNEALKPEQYKAYSEELDQLTRVGGGLVAENNQAPLNNRLGDVSVGWKIKQTAEEKQQEAENKQQEAEQSKQQDITTRINTLSSLAESGEEKAALSEAIRKQENNEQLSFAEQSLLLKYEAKLSNLKRDQREAVESQQATSGSLSKNAGYQNHNQGTNFFLNQALDANMR